MTDYFDHRFDRDEGRRYDPTQPRVPAGDPSHHRGRWTKEGDGSPSSAGATTAAPLADSTLAPDWVPRLQSFLRGAPPGPLWLKALALLRTLLVSTPAGVVTEGTLSGQPDVRYRYDEGFLSVYLRFGEDNWLLIFHGRAGVDGLFRLASGVVVGRDLGTGIVLNESAIDREEQRKRALVGAIAAGRGKDEPKLCPEETPERATNRDIQWRFYQYQITKTTPGMAVVLNGVEFDGCFEDEDGLMVETKGRGYATNNKLESGEFPDWYDGGTDIVSQIVRQSVAAAASGRRVRWYAAERPMEQWLKRLVEALKLPNIDVVHQPFVQPDQATVDMIRSRLQIE